ncbi:hypothetical protein FRC09_018389 [Ceratobasidium sp. 395]|nr:hypothetical protein FRC09_018389 [Ceratobasidium sp. 395]
MDKKELSTPPPYAPGSTFFFKIKFEGPYLMYREWRDATKRMLSAADKGQLDATKLSAYMLWRPETRAYIYWVTEQVRSSGKSLEGYNDGHGIIAARERFFGWRETWEGREVLERQHASAAERAEGDHEDLHKTVTMPVATPGSGKTAITIVLTYLFRFSHTQSGDVKQKTTGPKFVQNVIDLPKKNDAIYCMPTEITSNISATPSATTSKHATALKVISSPFTGFSAIHPKRSAIYAPNGSLLEGTTTRRSSQTVKTRTEECDKILDHSVRRSVVGLFPILDLEVPGEKEITEARDIARAYEVDGQESPRTQASTILRVCAWHGPREPSGRQNAR